MNNINNLAIFAWNHFLTTVNCSCHFFFRETKLGIFMWNKLLSCIVLMWNYFWQASWSFFREIAIIKAFHGNFLSYFLAKISWKHQFYWRINFTEYFLVRDNFSFFYTTLCNLLFVITRVFLWNWCTWVYEIGNETCFHEKYLV